MIYKHPEWKRLFEAIADRVQYGDLLEYGDLEKLSGVDIHSHRGRRQFHRFAKEMLVKKSVHFEPVNTVGYRAVQPREHLDCGLSRVRRARRRLIVAAQIVGNADYEKLTTGERAANADSLARIGTMVSMTTEQTRVISKAAGKSERLPAPALAAAKN